MASSEYTPLGGFEPKTAQNRLLETTSSTNISDTVYNGARKITEPNKNFMSPSKIREVRSTWSKTKKL